MHPVIVQTKFFALNTLWIFIAIGILFGTHFLIKLSVRNGLKLQFISDNGWKMIFWSIVGARIFNILINLDTYFYEFSFKTLAQTLFIWDKGLNLWGAVIAFVIYFYQLCKEKDQDFFKWMDVMVPSAIVLLAVSHIGAFFDGINYGKPTDLPWGVNFENFQIKYTVPIHPTQIYAFIYSSAIAAALIGAKRLQKIIKLQKKGFIALSGVAAYNIFRFLEDFLRGDDVYLLFGQIRSTMVLSAITVIAASVILYLRYNNGRKNSKPKSKK